MLHQHLKKIMTFPNAYEGLKKVFTAQILALISSGCYILGSIIAVIGGVTSSLSGLAGGGIFVLGGLVLSLLSLIFNLVGLSRASKDEPQFRTAFILSLINLILGIVVSFIMALTVGSSSTVSSLISEIFGILIIKFVFGGIFSLAEKLGRQDMIEYGNKLLIFLYVVYGLSIVLYILQLIFNSSLRMMATVSIMSLLSGIAAIVGYILYLIYLNRSKNMLA